MAGGDPDPQRRRPGGEHQRRAEFHPLAVNPGVERFGGGGWDAVWFAVVPQRIISWGIEAPAFSAGGRHARSVTTP